MKNVGDSTNRNSEFEEKFSRDSIIQSCVNNDEPIIFDIGAHHGKWTKSMMQIYPNAKYYLFEGIDYKELEKYNNNNNVYKNILLNDKEVEVDWYQKKSTGDSFFKELTQRL